MNDVSKFSNLKIQNGKKVIKKIIIKDIIEKNKSLFLYIKYKKYVPKSIDDNKNEYFAKLFKDKIIIIIGNKIFN